MIDYLSYIFFLDNNLFDYVDGLHDVHAALLYIVQHNRVLLTSLPLIVHKNIRRLQKSKLQG